MLVLLILQILLLGEVSTRSISPKFSYDNSHGSKDPSKSSQHFYYLKSDGAYNFGYQLPDQYREEQRTREGKVRKR